MVSVNVDSCIVCVVVARYRPMLPVDFIQQTLAFDSLDSCLAFLVDAEVTLSADRVNVDCKASSSG